MFVCISVSVCACSIGVSICSSIGLRVFWDWVVWISGGKFTAQRLLSSVPACTALLQLSSPVHWEKKLNIAFEHFTCMCIILYVHYMPIICINCIYILTFTSFTYSAALEVVEVNSLCVNTLGKEKKALPSSDFFPCMMTNVFLLLIFYVYLTYAMEILNNVFFIR